MSCTLCVWNYKILTLKTAAVAQWVGAFSPQAEGWVFETQQENSGHIYGLMPFTASKRYWGPQANKQDNNGHIYGLMSYTAIKRYWGPRASKQENNGHIYDLMPYTASKRYWGPRANK